MSKIEDFKTFESEYKKWNWFFKILDEAFNTKFYPLTLKKPNPNKNNEIYDELCLVGSRVCGKTINVALYEWWKAHAFQQIQFSFVWARLTRSYSQQVFKTLKKTAPKEVKRFLQFKKVAKKSKINFFHDNTNMFLEYKNATFQALSVTGIHNSRNSFEQSLLGWELGKTNARILTIEEAYQLNSRMISSAQLATRDQDFLFTIKILNNWLATNPLVKELDEKLPYDDQKMGKSLLYTFPNFSLDNLKNYNEDNLKKIDGFQLIKIPSERKIILRMSHVVLYKAGLLTIEDVKRLWISAKEDPARADTILWGKTSFAEHGIFSDVMPALKLISPEKNAASLMYDLNWKNGIFLVGIDSGYTDDASVIVCAILNADNSQIRIIETKIIKKKKSAVGLDLQQKSAVSFIKRMWLDFGQNCQASWLSMNSFASAQISIQSEMQRFGFGKHFNFWNFKKPLNLLKRANVVKNIISKGRLEIVQSTGNNFLIDEMGAIRWKKSSVKISRTGYDDAIEAFENALFPVWKLVENVAFRGKKTPDEQG